MKFFKNLSLIFICFIVLLSSGCGGQQKVYRLFSGAYWLADSTAGGIVPVYEKCTYSVSVVGSTNENLTLTLGESSFYTLLESTEYEGVNCYKFSTELLIKGSYVANEKTVEFDDFQRSECYFLGLSNNLTPLYSKKTVSSVTPIEMQDQIAFPTIAYSTEIVYDRGAGKANVKVTTLENLTQGYEYLAHEKTYEKYNANTFIDNECMLFLPRACQFEEGFSQRFYTLDALAQTVLPMYIGVSTTQAASEISLDAYVVDGKPLASANNLKKFPVYNVLIQINSDFSGKALEYCYTTTENDNRNRLISFKQQLPIDLGNLKFTLKSIDTHATQIA